MVNLKKQEEMEWLDDTSAGWMVGGCMHVQW